MLRRVLSLLVIAGLLAGQLAAVPHAHAGLTAEQQREHDANPHVHCHASHHHGHDHACCDHGHQHGRSKREPGQPLPDGFNNLEHDASAVDVAELAKVAPFGGNASPDWSHITSDVILAFDTESVVGLSDASSRLRRPPDILLDGSDTFLKLRNLRI